MEVEVAEQPTFGPGRASSGGSGGGGSEEDPLLVKGGIEIQVIHLL